MQCKCATDVIVPHYVFTCVRMLLTSLASIKWHLSMLRGVHLILWLLLRCLALQQLLLLVVLERRGLYCRPKLQR